MDDDILVRAITIGASVFITLATVTAVMAYYNTAKVGVMKVGTGTNIEENYREDIKAILYSNEVTGAQLQSILQYFYDDPDVDISLSSYYAFNGGGAVKVDVPYTDVNKVNSTKNSSFTQILKTMMPNQKFKITNVGTKYTFNLLS